MLVWMFISHRMFDIITKLFITDYSVHIKFGDWIFDITVWQLKNATILKQFHSSRENDKLLEF